ncbi:MAG: type II toxin-antitoxin system MqsA family antitoxin [Hydrogenophaga sp.]|uniref:type II TA system antitoxin MqsA family protein n=1 Tax=Hydrogenophaga sp. TaxID=1904254 RepID=UPI002730BFE7|nr:type II TA system antitoxin MqsA family protein [Hydrogenophaga sp.]MDP2015503.1 type II toxin-antitoxin system MqsA family antitoxin [Hydrogenophaga sp.]MDP3252990.1 type II toxin-antitoxin system MqsA family antitoxin [Hydrogenophaga sp.]
MQQLKPKKREPHRCARCAGEIVSIKHREDVIDFRGLTLDVEGLSETICNECGFTWTTDGQEQDNLARLKAAYTVERDAIRQREGLLSGDQVRFVLEALNLTRAEAASIFGGGPNAFAKYINGEVLQSFAMDRLLRLTLGIGTPALRYLKLGQMMPLELSSAGYFVAPSVSGNSAIVVAIESKPDYEVAGIVGGVPFGMTLSAN